jgi:hypothetical protein
MCERALVESANMLPGDAPVQKSIVARFPEQVVDIRRRGLLDCVVEDGYFRHPSQFERDSNKSYAISVIETYGDSADCAMLRGLVSDPAIGVAAIAAIKALEERR